jgi:hypothetical protein
MIATLLATMFAGAAILAMGTMAVSWLSFGFRFRELRDELRSTHDPVAVRYTRRDTAIARSSAMIYSLDFKAKADGLPFHPEPRHDLPVAA